MENDNRPSGPTSTPHVPADTAHSGIKPFYTVHEYAALLGLHHVTVRRLIYAGEIPAFKIGRAVRIPASALSPEMYVPVVGN